MSDKNNKEEPELKFLINLLFTMRERRIKDYEDASTNIEIPEYNIEYIKELPKYGREIRIYPKGVAFRKGYSYLRTLVDNDSIALYIKYTSGTQLLASLNAGTYKDTGYEKQIELILKRFKPNKEEIDEIVILKPLRAPMKGVYEIYSALTEKGYNKDKIKLVEGGIYMDIIANKNGIFLIDSDLSYEINKDLLIERLIIPGIKVENTNEIIGPDGKRYLNIGYDIEGPIIDILVAVPDMDINAYFPNNNYSVLIRLRLKTRDITPEFLEKYGRDNEFKVTFKEYETKGLKVFFEKYEDKYYVIAVWDGASKNELDFEIKKLLMDVFIESEIYENLP